MLSFVVPTRNSCAFICSLVAEIDDLATNLVEEVELCIIDDASTDKTLQIVVDYLQKKRNLGIKVFLYQNFNRLGQQKNALVALRSSQGSTICLLEDDMHLDKHNLTLMLDRFNTIIVPDVVIGSQKKHGKMSITSYIFWNAIKVLSRGNIPRREILFRVFNRESLGNFLEYGNSNWSITENCNRLFSHKLYQELPKITYIKGTTRHSFWHRMCLATTIFLRFARLGTAPLMHQVVLMLFSSVGLAGSGYGIYSGYISWVSFSIFGFLYVISGLFVFYNIYELALDSSSSINRIPKPKLIFTSSTRLDV